MRKLAHASIALTLLAGCTTHASAPQPQVTTASPQVIQPTPKTVKQASSTVSRTLPEPSQQPQFKNVASLEPTNWSNELCASGRYFPVKGASLAVWNSCQYINSKSLKAESIVLATAKDSENVADSMADKGFRKVGWKDFNPLTDKSASACIVYRDRSIACHKGDGSNEARKSTGEMVSSTSSEPSPRNDQGVADTGAVLTASDPDSQINLRATPETSGKYLGYGLIGDRVQVIEQATVDQHVWYKVRFSQSAAVGWIRGDFVRVTSDQPPSNPTTYPSSSETVSDTTTYYTPAVATSGGHCTSPNDLDSRGHRCGRRASGVRASSGGRRR